MQLNNKKRMTNIYSKLHFGQSCSNIQAQNGTLWPLHNLPRW